MKPTFDTPARLPAKRAEPAQAARLAARLAIRRDPAARAIVRRWRELTGGERTVVACSGGADSTALAFVLGLMAPGRVILAHVLHDMRPFEAAAADRDVVRTFADQLGLALIEREVVIPAGNAEAGARKVRYEALADAAHEAGCSCVATAHHADDQLETMLMAVMRGAGPSGLAGIASKRRIKARIVPAELCGPVAPAVRGEITLVRPMLRVMRADTERLCRLVEAPWRRDLTNEDLTRARGGLRSVVMTELRRLRPAAAQRAAESAELLAEAASIIEDHVECVFGDSFSWRRDRLARERALIIGEGIRRAHARLTSRTGADRLSKRRIEEVIEAVRDDRTHVRQFRWPGNAMVQVRAGVVTMMKADTE